MGTFQTTDRDSDPTLKKYFAKESDLPLEVRACLNREGTNPDLTLSEYFGQGSNLPQEVWAWLNREGAFSRPLLSKFVAPFPPRI